MAEPRMSVPASVPQFQAPRAVNLQSTMALEGIMPSLAANRVVFVGETHDRYDHHLNQLAVIEGLYARDKNLAIGMEFFQQPFQEHLDAYVAGEIDDAELLKRTEYFERWRFDFRLYAPILHFARDKGIPLVALNISKEITSKVAAGGLAALSEAERSQVPSSIDRSDTLYTERLRQVFAHHSHRPNASFDNFMTVQLLWDESMAETAARFLEDNPSRRLVVLAGSGHVIYGSGIPNRLKRRVDAPMAIVLNDVPAAPDPEMGDYLLFPEERALPPAGKMGAFLNSSDEGVVVTSFAPDSAAEAAGIKETDQILRIDDMAIGRYADVRIALHDKRPGDGVSVQVRRNRWLSGPTDLTYAVELR
jgi:uncharacterized iron-regulated protein